METQAPYNAARNVLPLDSKTQRCLAELDRIDAEFGRSTYDNAQRMKNRRRLQVDQTLRTGKRKYSAKEYRRLYDKQRGICPECKDDMALPKFWPGTLEMDHINVNVTGPEYDAESNRQVTHEKCNREKSSKSIPQLAKESARDYVQILTRT